MGTLFDITGADKVEVLRALYASAQPKGLGILHFKEGELSREDAEAYLKQTTTFDYLEGRVMKVDLGAVVLRTHRYDRDNGEGAAGRALAKVKGVKVVEGEE